MLFAVLLSFLQACSVKYIPYEPEEPLPSSKVSTNRRQELKCYSWENGVPDPAHPNWNAERIIRVNVHIMDNAAGNAHWPRDSARNFAKGLIRASNEVLDTNYQNWQSPPKTPVLPMGYRYQLSPQPKPGDDGIYFHYDEELWYFVSRGKYQNNYSNKVIKKYGIGMDSILNIFIQVHHPDSIKSPYYKADGQGIALGTSLKMAGLFESGNPDPGAFKGLMNHEVGHILGLAHAWGMDGCPDTKKHPNKCWVKTRKPPCDTLATNNMMDYNAYQYALTPCQLGKIHGGFSNEKHRVRKCLLPTWCALKPEKTVVIRDSVVWSGAHDLEGHLIVESGGYLEIRCRVSMPGGAFVSGRAGWAIDCERRSYSQCLRG